MTNEELVAIRVMVNDSTEPYKHIDDDIVALYDVFNGDIYRTASHLLLEDALSIPDPVAPTEPILEDPPSFLTNMVMQKWRNVNQDKLSVWQNELTAYRAQVDLVRAKQDMLQQMARSFIESTKGRRS